MQAMAETIDFAAPTWSGPEDVEARLARMPAHATAKGMFLWTVADTVARSGSKERLPGNYIRFKDYPMREFVELAPGAGRAAFPGVSTREGLRRLGQQVYPMFAKTLVGGAIFTLAARTFADTLRAAPRAYEVSITPGRVRLAELSERRAILELRDVWSFPESYHVGIFEGAMQKLGIPGRVLVHSYSLCDCDLLITW